MSEIRDSELSDLSVVASWIGSAPECRLWCGTRVSYPIDLVELPRQIEYSDCESWTLTDGDAVVAFGQLVSKPGGRLHLARLIAAPERRGSGLGRLITAYLLETALARGPSAVSLNVFAENKPALTLYESLGFASAIRPPEEGDSPSVYMEYVG
ncbi:MAG: GNAT family N-acetyltransferase [bacterium]|nr:GNAT family N-acetyltransferase [bacterium]